jgi:filamentous hemagglutinin family protein
MKRRIYRQFAIWLGAILFGSVVGLHAQVDISFDGTFQNGTFTGNDALIRPGQGSRAGSNQFYSFSRFSLPAQSSATFASDGTNVRGVFARVTGSDASTINGLLRSNWQGAHFFFMNPNGVMFGSGATLDIPGSFTVTSADYIEFADGIRYDTTATPNQPPILSASDPTAFGFLSNTPAGVSFNNVTFEVPRGESINVIAGDIAITGTSATGAHALSAPGGEIALISVGSQGVVHHQANSPAILPTLEGFSGLGSITVQNTVIDTSADSPGGGRIIIRGGQLMVLDSRISSDSSGNGVGQGIDIAVENNVTLSGTTNITSNANDNADAGPINLQAGSLTIRTPNANSPSIVLEQANIFGGITTANRGTGSGGQININVAGQTQIEGGGVSAFSVLNNGNSGDVNLNSGSLDIAGDGSGAFSGIQAVPGPLATGTGGEVNVNVDNALTLRSGGSIRTSTFSDADGGNTNVSANSISIDGSGAQQFTGITSQSNSGAGDSGSVTVSGAGQVQILGGGRISTNTATSGAGGPVSVSAGNLRIDGSGTDLATGITAETQAQTGGGDAGSISVNVSGSTDITSGGRISANTTGDGNGGSILVRSGSLSAARNGSDFFTGIFALSQLTDAEGSGGNSGDISVDANKILLRDGALIDTSTFGSGTAGSVDVNAREIIIDRAGSKFFTGIGSDSDGSGRSGEVNVNGDRISLLDGGLISTAAFKSGDAGDVSVNANQIAISGVGSLNNDVVVTPRAGIVASTGTNSSGDGGNVSVGAGTLDVSRGGLIGANSQGSGDAGSVAVNANRIALSTGGEIGSQSSASGAAGSVAVVSRGDITIASGAAVTVEAAQADAGSIDLRTAADLLMDDGSVNAKSAGNGGDIRISADGSIILNNGSEIVANSLGSGDAGSVVVSANRVALSTGSEIGSQSSASGNAGSVAVVSRGDITIASGAAVTVEAARANAGSIDLRTGADLLMNDGSVNAKAAGDGGDIRISADGSIILSNGSEIVAEAGNNGGNVTITDAEFVILNNSKISANAINGTGGNIQIETGILLTNNSPITASSQFGVDGTVSIDALFDLRSSLAELEDELLDSSAQLQPRCSVRIPGDTGSFILVGRGGLPVLPGRYMPAHQLLDLPEG